METALIIDQNANNREFLTKTLTNDFATKVHVSESALESFSEIEGDYYDLILIRDILPELSALEFIKKFRKKFPDSKSVLIVLTDKSDRIYIGHVFKSGADDYFKLPLINSEVTSKLQNKLDFYRAAKALTEQNERLEEAVSTATQGLQESDERYRLATEASLSGIWDWHLGDGHIFYSEAWCNMLGFTKEEVPEIPLFWTNRIHPEDLPKFIMEIDSHVAGRTKNIELEYRMRSRSGDYLWFKVKGKGIADSESKAIKRIIGGQTDISEVKEIQNQLLHNALHDNLTELPNRTLFNERVNQAFLRFKRYPTEKFAIIFFDLDKFKDVNDVYGHSAGDKLLKHVAQILKTSMREIDTVARLGGDEFVVLMDQIKSVDDVTQMIERVYDAAKHPVSIIGDKIYPQFSVGLSVSHEHHGDPNKVLKEADMALYQAKEAGRNQYVIYDPKTHKDTPRKVEMITSLSSALDSKEIKVYYQPIVHTGENCIWGYEALLRWHHPSLGIVSPIDFIPLAEDNDMILRLGDFVLRSALKQLADWRDKHVKLPGFCGINKSKMCINIAAAQVLQPNFLESLTSVAELYDISPSDIVLEFSEFHLSEIIKKNYSILSELRKRHFHVALDDFGEGRASVRSIVDYPLSILKIDRSLTMGIETDPKKRQMYNLVVNLGAQSSLEMVVEGVQNEEILKIVEQNGSHIVQGFYFSKPVLPDDLEAENLLLKKLTQHAS